MIFDGARQPFRQVNAVQFSLPCETIVLTDKDFTPSGQPQAAKVSFVPDMLRMNCPGMAFSMYIIALRPVQCVGMI